MLFIDVSMAKGAENFCDELVECRRIILSKNPAHCRAKFLLSGGQFLQVREVAPALVSGRIQLEMDLIVPTDEADGEQRTEFSRDQPLCHANGKAKAEKTFIRRAVVEPFVRQLKFD